MSPRAQCDRSTGGEKAPLCVAPTHKHARHAHSWTHWSHRRVGCSVGDALQALTTATSSPSCFRAPLPSLSTPSAHKRARTSAEPTRLRRPPPSASAMASAASPTGGEWLKEKKQAKQQWVKVLKDALDADSWGQSIEATEQYEKLNRMLEMQIPELQLNAEEKSVCMKIAHSVTLRMHTLQGQEAAINDQQGSARQQSAQKLTLDEIKALQPVLDDLFVRSNADNFPIHLKNYTASIPKKENTGEVFIAHDDRLEKEERGSLLMPPKVKAGLTTVSITIDKVGLKDAQTYINSYLTVSVTAPNGQILESQDTPKSNTLKPNYVIFGTTVHIQTTVEDINGRDLVLFFEFKHYKPAKKKISTRCFALMEAKEMMKAKDQPGVCLELYKKPTDFSRRSLSLFTIKQLYMHLSVVFTKH